MPTDPGRIARPEEPAVLLAPDVIGGGSFASIPVTDPGDARGVSGFAAFLDGSQDMRVVSQSNGIPIVWATASATVRARVNRRLVSWESRRPLVSRRFYLPFRYCKPMENGLAVDDRFVDTGVADASGNFPSRHPAALMEAAVKRVQFDREALERQLAEDWCGSEEGVLFVDGSITASQIVSQSRCAIGVIKSHRRLYAEGDAFNVLVNLDAGHRTSLFKVAPRSREAVASWYVRIRRAAGHDALFGLVRVEAAITEDIGERANEISRWLIAEGAPLALPDGRWDKMAYGIRHTEEFLRAIS
ncbi:MAG: hypothetical protein M3R07_04145 [Gemmatimonadota bacterium]|nr:hypothetical protein [Gemmatimonadota bacterium]